MTMDLNDTADLLYDTRHDVGDLEDGLARLRKDLEELKENGEESNPEHLCEEIVKMNIFNSVFVDCTASPDVAALYETLMNNNVSVVAANKEAASSSYDNYTKLKETARHPRHQVLVRDERRRPASRSSITMNDLINSGDHILKLEAVLSGTLNYIFNTISADIPFSEAIHMAKEAGYAERTHVSTLAAKT